MMQRDDDYATGHAHTTAHVNTSMVASKRYNEMVFTYRAWPCAFTLQIIG